MIEVQAQTYGQSAYEIELPIADVANELDVSTDDLVDAIEAEEIEYREIEAENGRMVIELEACGKKCRLRISG